ncbi:MAG: zinc ribbon domain-containing protein [Armatimonadota bacterium]|nr:zinc ribbon domain-containing protein [Armatimonadota bacterium]MCX7778522.1 zinc ribbon domain-containing protein [Armatimonadota bacterium]MDW8025817.1 zinc ribbon domain-containing protein [Armatimonadota bacterium]
MQHLRCPSCSAPVKGRVKFCTSCGSEITSIATENAVSEPENQQRVVLVKPAQYRRDIILGTAIAGVVTGLIAIIAILLLLHLGKQSSTQVLTTVEPPKSIVQRPQPIPPYLPVQSITPPPQTVELPPIQVVERPEPKEEVKREEPQQSQQLQQPQQPQKPQVPPDVLAYLRALERIERQRRSLSTGTGGVFELLLAAITLVQSVHSFNLDEPEGSPDAEQAWQRIANGFARYRNAYSSLLVQFRLLRPPAPCMQLAMSYDAALQEHVKIIRELEAALATRNIASPLFSLLTVSTRLKLPLKLADRELGNVCEQFSIPKFFDIGDE